MTEQEKQILEEENPEEEESLLTQDQFDMDVAWRFFFREMGKKDLIKILNVCTKSQFPLDTEVEFLDTTGRKARGPSAMYSREQDLVLSFHEKGKPIEKISLELQTYHNPEFSMRLFAYGFNTAEKTKENHYVFQKSCTFYMTPQKTVHGYDIFKMEHLDFFVTHGNEGEAYDSMEGDILCVKFPFINVLAMDWETLQSPDYALLQTLFVYRYVMNPNLILEDTQVRFSQVLQDVEAFLETLKDKETMEAHRSMYYHLVKRIEKICKRTPETFEKELAFMKTTFVDMGKLKASCREEGIRIGVEEGIGIGREEGIGIGREEGIGIGVEKGIGIGVEKGIGIGVEKGIGIGVEKGVVNTIAQMIQGGLAKMDIQKMLGCNEELYQKAYALAHS